MNSTKLKNYKDNRITNQLCLIKHSIQQQILAMEWMQRRHQISLKTYHSQIQNDKQDQYQVMMRVEKQTKYGEKDHEGSWNLHHSSAAYVCQSKEANIFPAKSFSWWGKKFFFSNVFIQYTVLHRTVLYASLHRCSSTNNRTKNSFNQHANTLHINKQHHYSFSKWSANNKNSSHMWKYREINKQKNGAKSSVAGPAGQYFGWGHVLEEL